MSFVSNDQLDQRTTGLHTGEKSTIIYYKVKWIFDAAWLRHANNSTPFSYNLFFKDLKINVYHNGFDFVFYIYLKVF